MKDLTGLSIKQALSVAGIVLLTNWAIAQMDAKKNLFDPVTGAKL